MHSRSRTLIERIICNALAFVIACTTPVIVRADNSDKAGELIQSTHASARLIAEDAFRYYLVSGIGQNAGQAQMLTHILNSLQFLMDDIKRYQGNSADVLMSTQSAIEMLENEDYNHAEFRKHLDQAVKAYNEALIGFDRTTYLLSAGESAALDTVAVVQKIVAHLQRTCDEGIAKQFISPVLPPITIKPPGFSIGFSYGPSMHGGDMHSNYQYGATFSPQMTEFLGENAGAYAPAAQILLSLAIQKAWPLLAGGAKMSIGTANIVAAVILICVFIALDAKARKDAQKEADAVESAFHMTADADDVARYYQETCEAVRPTILDLPQEIDRLRKLPADDPGLKSFQADSEAVESQVDKIFELVNAVDTRKNEILKKNGISAEAGQDELEKSEEFLALDQYARVELGFPGLMGILRVQLIGLALGSDLAANSIRKLKAEIRGEGRPPLQVQMEEQRQRILKLAQVSYANSVEKASPGAIATFKLEMEQDKAISDAYIRWQKLYGNYLSALFNKKPTDAALTELHIFRDYLRQLRTTVQSDALDFISRRLHIFLETT